MAEAEKQERVEMRWVFKKNTNYLASYQKLRSVTLACESAVQPLYSPCFGLGLHYSLTEVWHL